MSAAPLPASFQEPNLLVVNPSGNRTRMRLEPLPFTIGRQAGNKLVLRDNRVSRAHARIVTEGGHYFVEDLKSRHGVWVNGARIDGRRPLASGDAIEFGVENSYRLIFTLEESELLKLMGQIGVGGKGPAENLGKLRALVEVARTVQSALSADYVLSAVVDAAVTVTGAQQGYMLLKQDGRLEVAVARDAQGAAPARGFPRVPIEVLERALDQCGDLTQIDLAVAGPAAEGALAVPLLDTRSISSEETVMMRNAAARGALYLEFEPGTAAISTADKQLLQTLAVEASTILENARLLEQDRQRMKMEEELSIARKIQQSLMPRQLPQAGWFRAAVASIPSAKVGGDYCDVALVGGQAWGFVIADVSGKGVSAALLASLLQGAFVGGAMTARRLDELLDQVNLFLTERTQGEKYATLFAAVTTPDGRMRWTNAGHCPALVVRRSGELERLEPTSMPLGMLEEAVFEEREVMLRPGDKVLAYTDGVSEAQDSRKKFFGTRRIEEIARAKAGDSCRGMIEALVKAVDEFNEGTEQEDDLTAVAIEFAAV